MFTIAYNSPCANSESTPKDWEKRALPVWQREEIQGVLHEQEAVGIRQLINGALAKNPPHPLIVFIDTNLPPRAAQRLYAPRIKDGREIPSWLLMALLDRVAKEHGGNDPYAMLIFSNHPHHYASPDELDPQRNLLAVSARNAAAPLRPALHAFYTGAGLYGNIPNEFPTR